MENKQTAVEWLFDKLWDMLKDKFNWYAIRAKAKAMEREQVEEAYDKGSVDSGILSIGLNDYTSGSDYFTKKLQNGKDS